MDTLISDMDNIKDTYLVPYLKVFTGTPKTGDLTIVSITATILFMVLCAFYCSKLTRNIFLRSVRHRSITNFLVQEILFLTCLLNLWVVWISMTVLIEKWHTNWAGSLAHVLHSHNLKDTEDFDLDQFKIFVTFLFALTPVIFYYILKKFTGANRLWMYTQIHFHDEHNNEMGRSAFFLRFPPSRDMQQLLTLHDYYYLQQSGRPRKSRGIRKVNSLRVVFLRAHHGVETGRKTKSYESLPTLRLLQDQI